MYCRECGEKLTLRFCENEGLIPFCGKCAAYKFPQFPVAVSMVVTNRTQDKILLAKHVEDDDFILFAGYIKKGEDIILGLQTDEPLKRAVNPFAGYRNAVQACRAYGYEIGENVENEFKYRTTHNTGVFRVYTDTMKKARHAGILTGLPDAYARGRIIGDYRRIALYGMDYLIEQRKLDKKRISERDMDDETIRMIEDIERQLEFMGQLVEMAAEYGCDISKPAASPIARSGT
jgi:formate acetyltransferase 1